MDRIMDSGSIDWGSTPHGRTNFPHSSGFVIPNDISLSWLGRD